MEKSEQNHVPHKTRETVNTPAENVNEIKRRQFQESDRK